MSQEESQTTAVKDAVDTDADALSVRMMLLAKDKPQWFVGLGVVVFGLTGLIWYLTREEGPTESEQLTHALELVEDRDNLEAREEAWEIARYLVEINYRDPKFSWAPEFILGVTEFRDAVERDESDGDAAYIRAAHYLREAARQGGLPASHIPEWSYSLGVSLYRIGAATEARQLLEDAESTYSSGRTDAAMFLTDIYLDLGEQELLNKALKLNSSILSDTDQMDAATHDRVYLQRAQVYYQLGDTDNAHQALTNLTTGTSGDQGTKIFRAQTLMAEGKFSDALEVLNVVRSGRSLDQTYSRQAQYLIGICYEATEGQVAGTKYDLAIDAYRRTAREFPDSHEELAANVRAADLLRRVGRNEDSQEHYRRALQAVKSAEDFRNRWMSLAEFRALIQEALDAWVNEGAYEMAVALTSNMAPLFPVDQALGFAAETNRKWALSLEEKLKQSGFSKRLTLEDELWERWRISGEAHARLAEELGLAGAEYHWVGGNHFRAGQDFERAEEQIRTFINTNPLNRLPSALVLHGELLMDLDQLDEAQLDFERVIENYPTDVASYRARYVIGQCFLEKNELDRAEQAWRDILVSPSIDPDAEEWRLALFALGKLLYDLASITMEADETATENTAQEIPERSFELWDEAIARLEEFLLRYPDDERATEARFLMAKSLQHSAKRPHQQMALAETINARQELRRKKNALLTQAVEQFRMVQQGLAALDVTDGLDELGQRLLRDCYFEVAHTYYALEEYEIAIVEYGAASNRYPQDVQVLMAYVQMSNCYTRLGQTDDARSMLQQARIIHSGMPDEVFDPRSTNLSKAEWQAWLDWAQELNQAELQVAN